jgi:putative restriction endonuclease
MKARVEAYAASAAQPGHRVGCIMVSQPVFFSDGDWIEQPIDWKKNVVSGAGYDLTRGEGRRIWAACLARQPTESREMPAATRPPDIDAPAAGAPRFGAPQFVRPRLGQGTFRVAVTVAYGTA